MKQVKPAENTRQIAHKILPFFLYSNIFYTVLLPIVNYTMEPFFNQNKLFIKSWHPFAYATNHDAFHYIHIRYEWEMNYAFLPGYVTFLEILKYAAGYIIETEELSRILFVSLAVIINKALIFLSSLHLYRIARNINQKYAINAVILYLFNPASVFYHSLYSQPLSCFLTFWAVAETMEKPSLTMDEPYDFIANDRLALVLFFLSTTVRTTSQLYVMIFGLVAVKGILIGIGSKNVEKIIKNAISGLIVLMLFSFVMVLHNHVGYLQYCTDGSSWFCEATISNIYSSVQEKFWRVGFMKFFKMDEMGAWVVGLPTILVALLTNRKYNGSDAQIGLNWSYGLMQFITIFVSYIGSSVRFMSTQPLFYINVALSIDRRSKLSKFLVCYWLTYNVLGICIYGSSGGWY